MSNQKMLALHDLKAEYYGNPFFARTRVEAIRSLSEAVRDPNTQMHKHPADFSLVELGEYDVHTASFTIYEKPLIIENCANLQ